MRFLVLAFIAVLMPSIAGAQISPDGCASGSQPGVITCKDNSYTHLDLTSNTLNTGPNGFGFAGPIAAGDIVGVDYSFTYSGTPYTRQYRYTVAPGDTIRTVAEQLGAQWKADPIVVAAIGADIVSYAMVRQFGPGSWDFQFFEVWPVSNTSSVAFYSTNPQVVGHGAAGNRTLEANPYIACGRTTTQAGRAPMPGDRICNFYFTGDVTGMPLDQRNVYQTYAQDEHVILDPTPGVFKAKRIIQVDTLDLAVSHLTVNGQPSGPIGLPGPPGGNIAGSVVQSPALAVCADVGQPNVNCANTRVYNLAGLSITGWRTIATLTPSNVAGSWGMSKIKVELVTGTHGSGNGTLEGQIYISIGNGAPVGGWIGSPICALACPQLRTITTGNVVEVQVASPNGSNYIAAGMATVTYHLAGAEGNPVTWTIQ